MEHVVRTEHNIKFLGLAEEVKLIASSICITNSEIRGNVRFGNVIFMESAIFKGNNFRGRDVNFGATYFNGIADFSDTKFKYTRFVNFKGADFCDDAVFVGVNFSGRANFENVEFGGYADFESAEFVDNGAFGGAEFRKYF